MNRRKFLKNSALASGAVIFSGVSGLQLSAADEIIGKNLLILQGHNPGFVYNIFNTNYPLSAFVGQYFDVTISSPLQRVSQEEENTDIAIFFGSLNREYFPDAVYEKYYGLLSADKTIVIQIAESASDDFKTDIPTGKSSQWIYIPWEKFNTGKMIRLLSQIRSTGFPELNKNNYPEFLDEELPENGQLSLQGFISPDPVNSAISSANMKGGLIGQIANASDMVVKGIMGFTILGMVTHIISAFSERKKDIGLSKYKVLPEFNQNSLTSFENKDE